MKPFSWFNESRRGLTSGSKKRVFFGVLYFEDFARGLCRASTGLCSPVMCDGRMTCNCGIHVLSWAGLDVGSVRERASECVCVCVTEAPIQSLGRLVRRASGFGCGPELPYMARALRIYSLQLCEGGCKSCSSPIDRQP